MHTYVNRSKWTTCEHVATLLYFILCIICTSYKYFLKNNSSVSEASKMALSLDVGLQETEKGTAAWNHAL